MTSWTGELVSGGDTSGENSRQWEVAGRPGYVQSPTLPQPGDAGLLIRFEARTDKPATSFTSAYLFEDEKYRKVGQFGFSSDWRECTLLVNPSHDTRNKVQVDYPDAVEFLSIRNFRAIPVDSEKPLRR